MTVDVIYLAWNRLEFTRRSFALLLANTPWRQVRHLHVYDDGSTDGTAKYLAAAVADIPAATLHPCSFRSPPATMNHYLHKHAAGADAFAKIDNDICVPFGWLGAMLQVLDDHPELELLGMQFAPPPPEVPPAVYGYEPCSHIGGVGVMRVSAFRSRPHIFQNGGRFGFTEWQHELEPARGWIDPPLPVVELGRVPDDPWASLARRYRQRWWERSWPAYDPRQRHLWEWATGPAGVS